MDSELDTGADQPADPDFGALGEAAGAGPVLRAARVAKKMELAQLAAESRIPLRHLEALEANAFETLPSRTYAIGFARTYAKMVGLDDAMIADLVRSDLAGEDGRRALAAPGLAPGDPAKLPSSDLTWAAGFMALLVIAGMITFYDWWFGAGADPAPIAAKPAATAAPASPPGNATATAAAGPVAAGGAVVLTAMGEGVWLRITDADGQRLIERELASGERFAVPASARDPRINTGRPDLLAITVGGKPVAALADRPVMLTNAPISAAALTAPRPAATGAAGGAVR